MGGLYLEDFNTLKKSNCVQRQFACVTFHNYSYKNTHNTPTKHACDLLDFTSK